MRRRALSQILSPTNIASDHALLVSWLTVEPWPPWYDRLTLMFQREVAETHRRFARFEDLWTAVGAGGLAHASQNPVRYRARGVAVPPPKVTSSVVQLVPPRQSLPCDRRALEPRDRGGIRFSAARCCARASSRWESILFRCSRKTRVSTPNPPGRRILRWRVSSR